MEFLLRRTFGRLTAYFEKGTDSSLFGVVHSASVSIKLKIFKVQFVGAMVFLTSACSLDAEVTQINSDLPVLENLSRKDPDFQIGEVVTTSNGVVFKGVFGELSEKKVLDNGIQFEGAFYE